MNQPQTQRRNHLIDILRTLSALGVCLYHFNEPINATSTYYGKIVKYGWLGVPVFFVISGYCIMLSLKRTTGIKEFLLRRLFRIFPVYWFSLILVLCVAIAQKIITGTNSVSSFPTSGTAILATITLLTKPFSDIDTINWTYWSLTYEVFFYAFIAISMTIPIKHRIYFLFVISAASVLLKSSSCHFFFFLAHWPAFALGIAIWYYHTYRHNTISTYGIFAFALQNGYALVFGTSGLTVPLCYQMVAGCAALLLLLSPYIKLKKNIISTMANYSYGVYLIHVPLGIFVFGYLKNEHIIDNSIYNFLFDLSLYFFINVVACVIFKYIEQPAILLGRRIEIKLKKQTAAAL